MREIVNHPPGDEQAQLFKIDLRVFFFSLKIPNNPQGILNMGKFSTGSAGSPLTLGLSQYN